MTCAHCEELREEVAFYKRELGLVRGQDDEARLSAAYGLTIHEAGVLAMLYRRRAIVSKGQLWDGLYGDGKSEPEMKIIAVWICKLRLKLGKGAIKTTWGQGYCLTPAALAACDAIISGQHARAA